MSIATLMIVLLGCAATVAATWVISPIIKAGIHFAQKHNHNNKC